MRHPLCHPDQPHYSLGLCQLCYGRQRDKTKIAVSMAAWKANNASHVKDYDREYRRTRRKRWLDTARLIIYTHYGLACACCGEAGFRFLTIDHINNDGADLRRKGSYARSGSSFYIWLARRIKKGNAPTDLQTLCYNCNCGKARNGGICPHKDDIDG